jgi:hypothetical protein
MRFANDILELNTWGMSFGREPRGQLSGMKKLLVKGENGKFWASDFGIKGSEMVGLAYLPLDVIKETGVTKEVEITLMRWDWETQSEIPYTKKVKVKEWELLDYEKLARAYELIMALINL